jgi:rhamnogalacturonan endolyase
MKTRRAAFFLCVLLPVLGAARAAHQVERLDRGLVAVRTGGGYFVAWRLFGDEYASGVGFNLYRDGQKLNSTPLEGATCYEDPAAPQGSVYTVRPVTDGVEGAASDPARLLPQNYLAIDLDIPPGPYVSAAGYTPGDASAGDLDGDGELEIVLKWEDLPKDNSQSDITNSPILDAYTLDGERLWRINLGRNIREGAHYTQFMVYDLDGDGRAEVACKTADGTVDGEGTVIGDAGADYRNASGYILQGPEFLTIFDGQTGAALVTTDYIVPRHPSTLYPTPSQINAIWGDNYGNRVDRFLACVAYLDGERPSLVMCRGYYTRTVLAAWNWRDGRLMHLWTFDSDDGTPGNRNYRGQGNHNLAVGDLDGDGFDEIQYGACAIDHDGTGLGSSGLGHGDAGHLSDLDPDRPGLEYFQCHEGGSGVSFRDAATQEPIWQIVNSADVVRRGPYRPVPGRRMLGVVGHGTLHLHRCRCRCDSFVCQPRGVVGWRPAQGASQRQ